ncbi:MAG: gliding motility-associated C-terminal domain-containing protein [Bacteroidetes bacterium]|nr:gliding motility-associated C-terminal domain-containing protein [Bacteroidota bacterium]
MKYIYILGLYLVSFNLLSQRGKDGTPTISAANTIVNAYTSLTSNVTSGSTTLNVGNSSAFSVGDLVYIIQMQGANVYSYDGSFTGPWYDGNSAFPTDTTFGKITNYNNAGMNEFAQVNSIPNNTSIVIDCGLKNNYDVTKSYTTQSGKNITLLGNVQVIRVPRYASLTLNGTASISCPQWNGSTGGVAVVEVLNDIQLNSTGAFNVAGKGFRGGAVFNYTPTTVISSDKYGANPSQEGGGKGESIAGDSAMYRNYASVFCRGSIANGGGGANSHNSGGGGGANGHNGVSFNSLGNPVAGYNTIWNLEFAGMATNTSSGGGRGGYSFSNSNQNVSTVAPGTYSTPSNAWGGDKRRAVGGFGGRPLNYINGKLFLGGGGGAGHGNDNKASGGGNGGGIVYVVCYGNLSGTGSIIADGASASNTGAGCSSNDGAGGGGGGGAIVLDVNGTTNLTAATALSANGGNGGNVNFNCIVSNATAYGPGAGGGGGYIASTGTLPGNSLAGGNNGNVTGNANNIGNNFPPNGATKGGSGGTGSVTAYTLTPSASQTICTNQTFTVTATSTEPGTTINWYNTLTGNSAIATGTAYAAPAYATAGTYTLFAGACSGTYRQPIVITVSGGLNITANTPTICPGQTATLTASGATTYTWSSGPPNTNTLSVSPASTTVYTVNGTSGTCAGSHTTAVVVSSVPSVSVTSPSICSGNSATLTASGATNYTWSQGAQTTGSIVVTPTTTSSYTVTGSNGACTNSISTTVSVTATPTLIANSVTICPAQTASLTASGATTYTWNPGNVTGSSYTISPASNTTVSVTGANGVCTSFKTVSVTIGSGISISVNNPTICIGQTALLTANGATTYTWNTGPTTNTLSVSPGSTTTYTISGATGACTGSNTAVVTVVAVPSLTVANTSICSGNTATLTASGASSYTWAPDGQTTSSITDAPGSSKNYTITGSNGICTNTTTASVNVTATPTLVANSVTICPAQTATLNVSGATTFTWNPGNVTGSTYTISPASNTTVSVIGENSGCTSSKTVSVTIGTGISMSVNNPTICVGQSALLTANGASTYTWDSGANTNTLSISPASSTSYTVSGTSGSCTGSVTALVTVLSVPSLTVTNAAVCSGNTATLTASGASTYTWAPDGQTTASITDSPNSTKNYTVTGSNGVCSGIAITTISVTATPTLNIVNSTTICAGQTATISASGANSFNWIPGNVSGNIYTISPSSNTVVTVVGSNGTCSTQATSSVVIGTSISLSVNTPTICAGQTATLTANGAATYTWNSSINSNSISVNPSSTTVYTVSGSNGTCNGITTATVMVNAVPTLTVNSPAICSGQTATLIAGGANTYTWSNNVNGSTQTVSPSSLTFYSVSGTDLNGCINTSVTTATVNVTATPTINVNTASICVGQTATLTATGATTFTWSTNETTATINPSPVITTTYAVLGSNGACASGYTMTVNVTPSPTLNINASNTSGCAPLSVTFTDQTSSSCSSILYNFGDGSNGNSNNPNHSYAASGNYTVTATCTSTLGCSTTYTLPTAIQVILTPVANFNIEEGTTITTGSTVHLTNTSTNASSSVWDLCNGVTSVSTDVTTSYADTGSCCITLLVANGTCTNAATKCISIVNEATVVIPNVFTPNGDNSNEIFKIRSTGLKSLSCSIFDRWGLKMYEWDGVNGYWDGSAKSGMAPDGTYFYIITYTDQKDKTTTEKGFLNLFKN